MPFISNKERWELKAKINQNIGGRLFLLAFTIILSTIIVSLFIVFCVLTTKHENIPHWCLLFDENSKITTSGIVAVSALGLDLLFLIVSLILVFTIPRPKRVGQMTKKLITSPKGKGHK